MKTFFIFYFVDSDGIKTSLWRVLKQETKQKKIQIKPNQNKNKQTNKNNKQTNKQRKEKRGTIEVFMWHHI